MRIEKETILMKIEKESIVKIEKDSVMKIEM